jgi:hypothetical protein
VPAGTAAPTNPLSSQSPSKSHHQSRRPSLLIRRPPPTPTSPSTTARTPQDREPPTFTVPDPSGAPFLLSDAPIRGETALQTVTIANCDQLAEAPGLWASLVICPSDTLRCVQIVAAASRPSGWSPSPAHLASLLAAHPTLRRVVLSRSVARTCSVGVAEATPLQVLPNDAPLRHADLGAAEPQ